MPDPADRAALTGLVLQAQLGDEQAFTCLVELCHPRLRYFVRRLVGAPETAEDVMQNVWLTAYRKLPMLQNAGAFMPWLYGIARHKAYHALRQQGVQPLATGGQDEPVAPSEEPPFTPEDAAAIHRGLAGLAPEYREVLVLRFIESMSYQQIASVVGCELGTVKSRMHRAKQLLRRQMERKNHEQRQEPG